MTPEIKPFELFADTRYVGNYKICEYKFLSK
jgi:hypothetical protein